MEAARPERPACGAKSFPESRMRVAIYAIALDEERHVARFLASCAEADLVVVADTGSTDGTVAALREGGAVVHSIGVRPWRFDNARNAALDLVPPECDVCFALDLDEVLSPGWRGQLESAWGSGATQAQYRSVQAHRQDGSPAVEMLAMRIHARLGYRWRYPVHEMLVADGITPRTVHVPGMRLDHWPDATKNRGQYLPLLQMAAAEEPEDARSAFLLGREYVFLQRWAEGEATLLRYLALPTGRWRERDASAMRRIARCRLGLGDPAGAADWLSRALACHPRDRDSWVELADLRLRAQDWAGCHQAARRALAIPVVAGNVANDWRSTGARPHELAALSAFHLRRPAAALRHAEDAAAAEPWDARLRSNAERIRRWAAQAGGRRAAG
jgi:glycosyltransferase involved in cell wall biosynthesis